MAAVGRIGRMGAALGSGGWMNSPAYAAADSADSVVKRPGMIANFRTGRHAITPVATGSISAAAAADLGASNATFSDLFTFTRAGSATYIDASGAIQTAATDIPRYDYTNGKRQLRLEGAATNLFLNSAVGATQSISVSAVPYTLSFYGTGSITRSGVSSGETAGSGASVRTTVTFTPTAGSLTLTIAGSVTNVQLETGAFATSWVSTAGASVARAAESLAFSAKALALIARTAAGVVTRVQGLNGAGGRLIGAGGSTRVYSLTTALTSMAMSNTNALFIGVALTVPLPSVGVAAGWNGSGKAISYNGNTIATDAFALDATFTSAYLGRDESSNQFAFGWYDELIVYPFKPSNAALVAKAAAYV